MFSSPVTKSAIHPGIMRNKKKIYEKSGSSGYTLLELMIVIIIITILAVLAVPSFSTTLEKQRITNAAEAILADLRWARAEAIKRNTPVRVTFTAGPPWSYTINTVPTLAFPDGILPKTVNSSDFPSITLTSASFGGNVAYTTFDPVRGLNLNNGSATISSDNFSASVTVSQIGRVRICNFEGYGACQ